VTIPLDSAHPLSGSIISSEPDTGVEMITHIALTSLYEDPLLPIRNQENPIWQQCLEAMFTLEGPHFHAGMTSLARYAQYLFSLQHRQDCHAAAYASDGIQGAHRRYFAQAREVEA
jgi:hypothetical protein